MKPNEWSKAVIARDGQCVDCGLKDPLHAHHVKPKSTHPELKFDLTNGVAVCPSCHWKRHRGVVAPRVQAKTRSPHRKTMERQIEYLTRQVEAYELGKEMLVTELKRLEKEVVYLKRLLRKSNRVLS